MSKFVFLEKAWTDYTYWQTQDKKILKKINDLLNDIGRNGYDGIGHPEPLRENLAGWWSRKIDEKNRLVYRLTDEDSVEIAQCKGHYNDN